MRRILSLAILFFVGCGGRSDDPTEQKSSVEPLIEMTISNGPGSKELKANIPVGATQEERDDIIRETLGMKPGAEEKKVKQYIDRTEVSKYTKAPCQFVAIWNARAYYDAKGEFWDGVLYDAAVVPVLGEEGDYVKTLGPDYDQPHKYLVLYFKKSDLTTDPKLTRYTTAGNDYSKVEAMVPELCTGLAINTPAPESAAN